MASSWGSSWGSAWGNSWGSIASADRGGGKRADDFYDYDRIRRIHTEDEEILVSIAFWLMESTHG